MLVYGECECFVMQMLYVLCASYGNSQCCVLHTFRAGPPVSFSFHLTSSSVGSAHKSRGDNMVRIKR